MAAGHDASQGGGRGRGSKRRGWMRGFLLRAVITALGLWLASAWVSGARIHGPGTLILAALLLGVVNAVVRPIAVVLTRPLTVLTLRLSLLVLTAAMGALGAPDRPR